MKKIVLFTLSLCLIVSFSQNIQAQPWKKIADKAKNVTKGVKNDNKNTETNQTSSNNIQNNATNNQKPTNLNQDQQATADPEFKKWFEERYDVIFGTYYYMGKYALESVTTQLDKQLEGARLLDYPNSVKTINEKISIAQATVDKSKIDWFMGYEKTFTGVFQNKLKPRINKKIEEAYQIRLQNNNAAISAMVEATKIMELIELVIPNNSEVKELKQEVDKSSDDILKEYFSKIYTSDFHKNNKGKVLFSKQPIDPAKADPNQFTTEFTVSDNIYAIVYLGGTIRQITNDDAGAYYLVNVDKNSNKSIQFAHNDEDMDKSWYPIEIIPAKENAIHGIDAVEFGNLLSGLSPRKHTIKLTLGYGYSKELASGEFNIDLTGMDAAKIKANGEEASKNAKINWDKNRQLPDYVKTAKGQKYSSPELSETNIKTLILNDYKDAVQITKIVYYDKAETDEWVVRKNSLGVPLEKISKRVCFVIYKGKDGWCYYINALQFRKPYTGGGKYGTLERNRNDKPVRIDCKNCQF